MRRVNNCLFWGESAIFIKQVLKCKSSCEIQMLLLNVELQVGGKL